MLFPKELTRVKPGTVMIEIVLSGDPLLYYQPTQNQLKNLRFCSIKYANRVTYV